ncbi:MAG TPA: tetratricopeptide repeat protein [bacterium]|nr:tetratricopeptide repeat protein [bacterium]
MKNLYLVAFMTLLLGGCHQAPSPATQLEAAPLERIKESLRQGRYDEALALEKDASGQLAAGPAKNEALFLQTYTQMVGRGDLGGARVPLRPLVATFPSGFLSVEGQKALADCHFWQGHYQTSAKEYRKLLTASGTGRWESYALFQIGLCLLLEDKVTEALDCFQNVVDRFPKDPMADAAQFSIVNSYLKLQDLKNAKTQLHHLITASQDPFLKTQAQESLQQIVEKETFEREKSVTP